MVPKDPLASLLNGVSFHCAIGRMGSQLAGEGYDTEVPIDPREQKCSNFAGHLPEVTLAEWCTKTGKTLGIKGDESTPATNPTQSVHDDAWKLGLGPLVGYNL